MAAGNVVLSNAPGAGVLEAPAFAAFLPRLATRLTGDEPDAAQYRDLVVRAGAAQRARRSTTISTGC